MTKRKRKKILKSLSSRYWHELRQDEIEYIVNLKLITVRDILDNLKQPDWCGYPEALSGIMGCWSLTDGEKDGLRTCISKEYCGKCDEYRTT